MVLFGILKQFWREERDRWEREEQQKVSKENFLLIYGRAWIRAATPEVIKAAFSKTGVWPCNRNQIPPSSLAPSRETSYRGSLPFTPPSPIRAIADAMALQRTATASSGDSNTQIDPVLRTAQCAQQAISSETSLAFLTSSSPIQSSSHLPEFNHPPPLLPTHSQCPSLRAPY